MLVHEPTHFDEWLLPSQVNRLIVDRYRNAETATIRKLVLRTRSVGRHGRHLCPGAVEGGRSRAARSAMAFCLRKLKSRRVEKNVLRIQIPKLSFQRQRRCSPLRFRVDLVFKHAAPDISGYWSGM